MKQFLLPLSIAVFAIFVGAQITEGVLLVPYWQSLPSGEFYAYYHEFGHAIGRFFTVLTIVAALIPVALAVYCRKIKPKAFILALVSCFFAVLFVASFYIYFKGTNELFFQASLSEADLKSELLAWSCWHWGRVVAEVVSLVFLMLALGKIQYGKNN